MKRIDLSVVLDGLFLGFTAFLTLYVLFSTFASLTATRICSGLLGALAAALGMLLLARRRNKKILAAAEAPKKDNLMFFLALNDSDRIFLQLFESLGKPAVLTPTAIFLTADDAYVFHCFSFDGVSKNLLGKIAAARNGKTAFLIARDFAPDVAALAAVLGIVLVGGDEVYGAFKRAGLLPQENYLPAKKKREALKLAARQAFTRRRAPRYFLFGVVFLLFSFLVPFRLFYILFGAAMMILSSVCLFLSPAPDKGFF